MTVYIHFQEVQQQTLLESKAFQELGHVFFMKIQMWFSLTPKVKILYRLITTV